MKNILLVAVMVMGLAGLAFAAAEWQENGTIIGKTEKLNFSGGPNVTKSGTVTTADFSTMTGNQAITGDVDVTGSITTDSLEVDGGIYVDGTIYNAVMVIGNRSNPMKLAGPATLDPCPTLGKGTIFIGKGGMPCFCNAAGVDLSIYDGTTACW